MLNAANARYRNDIAKYDSLLIPDILYHNECRKAFVHIKTIKNKTKIKIELRKLINSGQKYRGKRKAPKSNGAFSNTFKAFSIAERRILEICENPKILPMKEVYGTIENELDETSEPIRLK